MEKNAYTIAEFCRWNSVGKTMAYEEIKSRRLEAIKVRRRTLITAAAEQAWLATLPRLSAHANKA